MIVRLTAAASLLALIGAASHPARAASPASKPSDFGLSAANRAPHAAARLAISTTTIENVPVCTAILEQHAPAMTQAGGGGIAVWDDERGGGRDIYAQKLGAGGVTQWVLDGVPVCKATGTQRDARAIPDGAGGTIVVWQDGRGVAYDIYAQRIDAVGIAQWTMNGVLICGEAGDQKQPVVVSDGQGGAVVAWLDERWSGSDVYAQRIGAGGAAQWSAGGVAVCTAAGVQQDLALVSDGQRGAIVVWQDERSGDGDIYARRVDETGVAQWGVDGVSLCGATGEQEKPSALADGSGGALVVWEDRRTGTSDIYGRRVSGAGAVEWAADGVGLCTAGGDQVGPVVCGDGSGGALAVWQDGRPGGQGQDVYGQRVSGAGAVQWAVDGVGVCTASADQVGPTVAADPLGGAVVAWSDGRTVANGMDIYVQHVGPTGASQWTADGVWVCDAAYTQDAPRVMADGVGGAQVVWRDYRPGATCDLYGQHVDAGGQVSDLCTDSTSLAPDTPVAASAPQDYFTFDQADFYWCGVGVRGASGSDWDMETYQPVTFGSSPYPTCFSGPLAGSFAGAGVDFVVGDFNIGHTPPVFPGEGYGVRAFRYTGAGAATVEWDSGTERITKDCGTGGNCGAKSSNNWSGMLDVWDVYLLGGRTYSFDFTRTGSADIKLLLFGSMGTTGPFFQPRGARLFETTAASHQFTAPDTAWYGVVLVNDNGLTGTYTARVVTLPPVGVEETPPSATGLRAVAPNPSAGRVQIQFALREPATTAFDVLDLAGRRVARIPEQRHEAGVWSAGWEGRTSEGTAAPPGVYFVQMWVDGRRAGLSRLALIR